MNLFMIARLQPAESVLLHGGGGGVNTAAIQIVKVLNPEGPVFVTASPGKVDRVRALGVDLVIDYRAQDFAEAVLNHTNQRGSSITSVPIISPETCGHSRSTAGSLSSRR